MKFSKAAKTGALFFVVALFSAIPVAAPQGAGAALVVSPYKEPRMVTVSFGKDSRRDMAFNWNTTDYTDSDVQIVRADDESGFSSSAVKQASGTVAKSAASTADGWIHSCSINGLSAGTEYLYRVGDKELDAWSETGSFSTAKGEGAFTFLHLSDPQGWEEEHYETYGALLNCAVQKCSPDFIALTGDIVNNSWAGYTPTLEQWEWALTDTFSVLKDVPVMPVAGNHEAADHDFSSRFTLPVPEGSDTKTGAYYSFDYNNAHFICLNTNDTENAKSETQATGLSAAQYAWLEEDLKEHKDAEWLVVEMHKGVYDAGAHCLNTTGEDYDIAKIRGQVAPLFTKYGVDLVLQGHDHLYSRSYPLVYGADGERAVSGTVGEEGRVTYEDTEGTVYLNSGTASGSKYYAAGAYDTSLIDVAANPGRPMFSSVTIDGGELTVDTYLYGADGAQPYQSFSLVHKQSGGGVWLAAGITAGCVVLAGGAVIAVVLIRKRKKQEMK